MLMLRILSLLGGGALLLGALVPGVFAVHAGQLWWSVRAQDVPAGAFFEIGNRFFAVGEVLAGATIATLALVVVGAALLLFAVRSPRCPERGDAATAD